MGGQQEDPKPAPATTNVKSGGTEPGVGPKPAATKPGVAPPLPPRALAANQTGPSAPAPAKVSSDTGPNGTARPPALAAGQAPPTPPPPPKQSAPSIPIDIGTDPPPAAIEVERETENTVDFDALNAALGASPATAAAARATPAAPQVAAAPPRPATAATPATPAGARKAPVAESQGRSSATYASAQPHALQREHIDADLTAPAVIVAGEDPVPASAPLPPPNMHQPSSGPHVAHPPVHSPLGGMPAASSMSAVSTPMPFPVPPGLAGRPSPGQIALTMRMPERPRRPKSPTVVVRNRGPSTRQKIAVFVVMLMLVSVCGLGIVMWKAPHLFGLAPKPNVTPTPAPPTPPSVTAPTASAGSAGTTSPSASASSMPAPPSTSGTPSASASAKGKPKPPR